MLQAQLRVLSSGQVRSMTVELAQPVRLIPVHTKGRPPSYFIIAGLVFGQVRALLNIAGTDAGPAVLFMHTACVLSYTPLVCHAGAIWMSLVCSSQYTMPARYLHLCLLGVSTRGLFALSMGVLPLCLHSFLTCYVLRVWWHSLKLLASTAHLSVGHSAS